MSAKIAKTIARQKEKIAAGEFYEAHQQFRVITARYLKASDYASAASVLHNGALLLLRAGQGGSGGDLARMLINDVYDKGEYDVTDENKKRVIEILKAFPPEEPTRKRYITEMITWSGKFGEMDRGDPEIHHEVGSLYAQESEPYDAERHLLLGLDNLSPPVLAKLQYRWYTSDSPHTAALYASRSILPYLLLGNLSSANNSMSTFTSLLTTSPSTPPTQTIESSKSSIRIFPSLPLLNFLSLLLLACQKGDSSLFRQLTRHYAPHLKDVEEQWSEILAQIGEIWFGIRLPRQGGNPLFDMMGSMLFGGGGGGAGSGPASGRGTPKPNQKAVSGAGAGAAAGAGASAASAGAAAAGPPVAMDLD